MCHREDRVCHRMEVWVDTALIRNLYRLPLVPEEGRAYPSELGAEIAADEGFKRFEGDLEDGLNPCNFIGGAIKLFG